MLCRGERQGELSPYQHCLASSAVDKGQAAGQAEHTHPWNRHSLCCSRQKDNTSRLGTFGFFLGNLDISGISLGDRRRGSHESVQRRGEGNVWRKSIRKLSLINLLLIEKKKKFSLNAVNPPKNKGCAGWIACIPGTTWLEHLIFPKHDGNLSDALLCLQRGSSPFHLTVYFTTSSNLKLLEPGENATRKLNYMSSSSWENLGTKEVRGGFLWVHVL